MGVRGLESFLLNQVPNGVFSINILEEINRKKSEHPDKPVILVFQVVDILYNIASNLSITELICGPSFQKIHQIFETSFQQLENAGVELHFFISGPVYNHDLETWASKESDKYLSRIALIDKIDSNVPIEKIKKMEKLPGTTAPVNDLLSICRKYGTVHVSLKQKYIVDVVKYSNENDALAILSNSSHFLIFDGDWRYWSCRNIGLMEQNWNTLEYNRSVLLEHIGLSRPQMAMLAITERSIRIPMSAFFDLRRTDFLPFIDIILPILKRQIGLVRKHKNDTDYQQVLELKLDHSNPPRSIRVTPEYPKVEILDLMELSFNRNNDYFNTFRFRLLKWMVFGVDGIHPQFSIQDIPEGYMVTVLADMYLCKLKQLSLSEADAILLSIHLTRGNTDYDKDFDVPINISSRHMIASHLYIYVHNKIVKCFLFLGLESFVDYLSIDGVYFVQWANKIKTEDCDETLSQIEYLKYFLRFI